MIRNEGSSYNMLSCLDLFLFVAIEFFGSLNRFIHIPFKSVFFKRLGVYHQGGRNFSLRTAEAVRPQLWEPLQLLRDGKRPSLKGLPANMGISNVYIVQFDD